MIGDAGGLALAVGRLLVANPLMPDPNFDRTVVLLIAYGDEGALGLVLNRPSPMRVAEPLPRWEDLAASPRVLFFGGPVQHQAVICLARQSDSAAAALPEVPRETLSSTEAGEPPSIRVVTPGVVTVDLDGDPSDVAGEVSRVRLFAGYAGWAGGQLEGELTAGAWWVLEASADDAFTSRPTDLWREVLRRQPAPLCFVAYFPDDPTHN